MYKVYAKTDSAGSIISVNSAVFLPDTDGWTQIDEGEGDRYHHAQGNYLEKPLTTKEGVYRYKLVDGQLKERTQEEIQEDIDALPPPPPSTAKIQEAGLFAFKRMAETGAITETEAIELKEVFPTWQELIGKPYYAGLMFRHGEDFYKVNDGKSGTFQQNWPPDQTASEYSKIGNPEEEWPEYVPVTGAHNIYHKGAKVTYEGDRWILDAETSAYAPGVVPGQWIKQS